MKLKKLPWRILILTVAVILAVLAAAWVTGRPPAGKFNTVHFAGVTNGVMGVMATTYQGFSTNHAATVQRWLARGTNAVLLRVTNNQDCAVWVQPFASINFEHPQPTALATIILDAPNFSGIRLAAGQATNVQVMLLAVTNRWRVRLSFTHEWTCDSFMTRMSHLPRDLRAYVTGSPIQVRATSMDTDWIERLEDGNQASPVK